MSAPSRFDQLTSEVKQHIQEIAASEASAKQAAGALLVDVREADEYAREHARGALPLSRGVLEMKIESAAPDAATPIVRYCGGGKRSALAAESLQRMGYTNVYSLIDGFRAWKGEGLPTE